MTPIHSLQNVNETPVLNLIITKKRLTWKIYSLEIKYTGH